MRGHKQIIADAGGAEGVCARFGLNLHTVRSWMQRERIPKDHWRTFIDAGVTTLDELYATSAPRKVRKPRKAA